MQFNDLIKYTYWVTCKNTVGAIQMDKSCPQVALI